MLSKELIAMILVKQLNPYDLPVKSSIKGGGGGSKAKFFGGSDMSFGHHRCP